MESGTRPVKDLDKLLANMAPVLQPGLFVFCSVLHGSDNAAAMAQAVGIFVEDEGLSLILPRAEAANLGLSYDKTYRMITLMVYSDLEAVGLTAVVSEALAKKAIAANFVAATQHDHIFVPARHADNAFDTLRGLQKDAQMKRTG